VDAEALKDGSGVPRRGGLAALLLSRIGRVHTHDTRVGGGRRKVDVGLGEGIGGVLDGCWGGEDCWVGLKMYLSVSLVWWVAEGRLVSVVSVV
jgi:hypothetical protein